MPTPSPPALRVGLEIENIGERVAASKKRLSWRFVFDGCEEVHTVTLEHSRVTAKKRVKLDGKRIGASESYAGGWTFDFSVPSRPSVPFQIVIKDINQLSFVERAKAKANLTADNLYVLLIDRWEWDSLPERELKYERFVSTKWSSKSYARRVHYAIDCNEHKDVRVAWTFTFGQDGPVHQLLMEDCADGSKSLVLDRTSIRHEEAPNGPPPTRGSNWHATHEMGEDKHELAISVSKSQGEITYALHINGSKWEEMAETEYVLEPGFYPVFSKSTGRVYYRNDTSKQTTWTKPSVLRSDVSKLASPEARDSIAGWSLSPRTSALSGGMMDLMSFHEDGTGTATSSRTSSLTSAADLHVKKPEIIDLLS
ncbi:hypothetical protein SDRG_03221 [Saprolegnia diclina VS20]|uniref:WW domain-containing protein n=1 Tax=Saprolegnia diclina (strain VS20) TaxID=1156394 RepID=T0S3Y2_SAPDV|nr:hypothetical protein SDRG_03221 [Saprolegnia diclina VS20]EQC39798.1 hypothetical protein SDRG_03221 [Saprolegnia diclina VS20]|eukprot:XP_008607070.1 hypothetical protein SDRG_03221 [Saprolegnia diclina VS20]